MERSESFKNYVAENRLKEAYDVFRQYPRSIMHYYQSNGQDVTNTLLDNIRGQIGWFQSARMKISLERFVSEKAKIIKRLKAKTQELKKQSKIESRVSPETWKIEFNI